MPELLIVGGLTVDRFPDGRRAPGGSVLHAAVAASGEGVRPATATVAGDEPEARAGLERLRGMGEVVVQASPRTTTYAHSEHDGRRVLVLEASSDPIAPATLSPLPAADVALFAPIADELPAAAIHELRARLRPRLTVLLIQGWLRRLVVGEPVHPLPLADVERDVWDAFALADAVVVSTEDITETPGDPFAQALDVRGRLGPGPILVVTLGSEGYLLDDPRAPRIVASVPRTVVRDVPTVGAGDTFGAALALHLGRGRDPVAAAEAATERVIAVLEGRRS
ncbi:MAG TPA: PfkB family carbohydrate kinase [Candidatus Limnocylindria bacterium]|jgi:sugar/nucleoside kinase (ribokinase family)|nr:PfkB family carbohydrate kinase [Candidatus Limnocylindria bacterium]